MDIKLKTLLEDATRKFELKEKRIKRELILELFTTLFTKDFTDSVEIDIKGESPFFIQVIYLDKPVVYLTCEFKADGLNSYPVLSCEAFIWTSYRPAYEFLDCLNKYWNA